MKGRGHHSNPHNRFEKRELLEDFFEDEWEKEEEANQTNYRLLQAKSIVNKVPSPDIGMDWSMNPYQGCEHGCVYCYARPTHEYWGLGQGVDFEREIMVKQNCVSLLRDFISRPGWKGEPIMLSGNTDCYQPAERKFQLTRQLLEVFRDCSHPVGIITKNALILRDLDLLAELARQDLVAVVFSLTSLNEDLRRKLEPRTSTARNKLKAIKALSETGVHVTVNIGPVIPGLNDHELPDLLRLSAEWGAADAQYIMLRLNGALGPMFTEWLEREYPVKKKRVLANIRSVRNGQLGETEIGKRMKGQGHLAESIDQLFKIHRTQYFGERKKHEWNRALFRKPGKGGQLGMF